MRGDGRDWVSRAGAAQASFGSGFQSMIFHAVHALAVARVFEAGYGAAG